MASSRDIQQGVSNFTHILGLGLMYAGAGALFTMAVVGTIAVDLVLLSYASQHHEHFLTAIIWYSLISNNGRSDPTALLIASPITSVIAIALSFALGVPGVGAAIALGWGVAIGVFALGFLVEALAEAIKPGPEFVIPPAQVNQAGANPQAFFNPLAPPPPYTPPSSYESSLADTGTNFQLAFN